MPPAEVTAFIVRLWKNKHFDEVEYKRLVEKHGNIILHDGEDLRSYLKGVVHEWRRLMDHTPANAGYGYADSDSRRCNWTELGI